ncbi:MAG TPA: MAPEG family protein [Telluria sp.]
MTSYPALPVFVAALIGLFAKTSATSVLQVVSRARARTFLLPEDAAIFRTQTVFEEAPLVRRCAGVWRNDVENLPLFLALALTYVLLGAASDSAALLFGLYVALRYLHSAAFLLALQPWRAILFILGQTVCWIIAVRICWMVVV